MSKSTARTAGIYIHIPFCQTKCGYCDFYSVTDLKPKQSFVSALISEIHQVAEKLKPDEICDTIYFGGGTPSLLSESELEQILRTLNDNFKFTENPEVTLEANPGTLSLKQMRAFRELGINRLSIGIQSFNDKELRLLERIHSAREAIKIVEDARVAGFENLSIDLIFALPGQSLRKWEYNLQKAIELDPEHISAYSLIFEEGTPFYIAREAGKIKQKPEQEELEFYNLTIEKLIQNGYQHYEVSNFARSENLFSRHNQKYWDHSPYLGFGPSAHSYRKNKRWNNVSSVSAYIQSIFNKKNVVTFQEHIDERTREFENIFLSLRTITGLNMLEFKLRFKEDFKTKYKYKVDQLVENGLAEFREPYFRLTRKGLFISDAILSEFA